MEETFVPPGTDDNDRLFPEDLQGWTIARRLHGERADTIDVVNDWHYAMINDKHRNDAYEAVIKKCVQPDSIVVEIGAGSGILSIMAAKAGAKKVYAIEGNERFCKIARENIAANGVSDIVQVIPGMSENVNIPEKATILLGEIVGTMMDGESATHYYQDAKARLCEDDAVVIPARGTQFAALIESDTLRSITEVRTSKLQLKAFNRFRDSATVIKSKNLGATLESIGFSEMSDPIAIYEADWQEETDTMEEKKIEIVKAKKDGVVTAIMYWWEIDLDNKAEHTISTHPSSAQSSLMRNVQWGQGVTLVESYQNFDDDYPKMLEVKQNEGICLQFDLVGGFHINGRVVQMPKPKKPKRSKPKPKRSSKRLKKNPQ